MTFLLSKGKIISSYDGAAEQKRLGNSYMRGKWLTRKVAHGATSKAENAGDLSTNMYKHNTQKKRITEISANEHSE